MKKEIIVVKIIAIALHFYVFIYLHYTTLRAHRYVGEYIRTLTFKYNNLLKKIHKKPKIIGDTLEAKKKKCLKRKMFCEMAVHF